ITRNEDSTTDSLDDLSEREILEKVVRAVENRGIKAPAPPVGFGLSGARKIYKGAAVVTANSKEAGIWLRRQDVLREINKGLGGTTTAQANPFSVLLENIPISFDPDSKHDIRQLEIANDLPEDSIRMAKWLKAVHLRKLNQHTGHLHVGLDTRE